VDLPEVLLPDALLRGRRAVGPAQHAELVMKVAADVVIAIVALQHLLFLYLEAFLWTKPQGRTIFNTTAEQAELSADLAKNQGVYNGFLAAGLIWGIVTNPAAGYQIKLVFLICVLVAALVGGLTVSKRILVVQGAPAAIALVLVLAGGR
jgi:putative membrane protein